MFAKKGNEAMNPHARWGFEKLFVLVIGARLVACAGERSDAKRWGKVVLSTR